MFNEYSGVAGACQKVEEGRSSFLATRMRRESRAILWMSISLGALAALLVSISKGDERNEERSAQLLAQMRSLAEQTTVRFAKGERRLEFIKNPVFRYSDQPRQFIDATLWVWTNDGRPVAFQKIEALEFGAEATRPSLWQLCFASVSADLVVAQWPEGHSFQSTEPGLTFRALNEAPAGATGNSQRKRQTPQILPKFSARILTNPTNNTTPEMRLPAAPIFDYEDRSTGELVGSV